MKTKLADTSLGEDAFRASCATAISFYEAVNTPRSLGLALRLQYGLFDDIANYSVSPRDYCDGSAFALDYGAGKFLAKASFLNTTFNRADVALGRFKAAEAQCHSTNIRLTYARPLKEGVEAILEIARRKISRIIGQVPNYDEIVKLSRFGPGATATLKGADARPENKILEPRISVTPKCLRLAQRLVGQDLHWSQARLGPDVEGPCSLVCTEFVETPYMRVVTVPKDSKTDRTIGAEPTFNTWLQAGVGRSLRRALDRVGVDLSNQAVNQTWAELALDLGLATVDLSAASDSISYWLVEELFPPAWFTLLDALRSSHAKLPSGKILALEKFSSMGNGFTFELETLIFYAIGYAVCVEMKESPVCLSVYGDDIIIPSAAYSRLVDVLKRLGFSVNNEKSYADGLFYESCGEHFFDRARVTPLYQKELLHDLPDLVRSHNRIFRWWDRIRPIASCDARSVLAGLRSLAARACATKVTDLPSIPCGMEGDSGFLSTQWTGRWSHGQIFIRGIQVNTNSDDSLSDAALLAISFQVGARGSGSALPHFEDVFSWGGKVALRDTNGYRITSKWIHVPIELTVWTCVTTARSYASIAA